jgi:hypothetical protein
MARDRNKKDHSLTTAPGAYRDSRLLLVFVGRALDHGVLVSSVPYEAARIPPEELRLVLWRTKLTTTPQGGYRIYMCRFCLGTWVNSFQGSKYIYNDPYHSTCRCLLPPGPTAITAEQLENERWYSGLF